MNRLITINISHDCKKYNFINIRINDNNVRYSSLKYLIMN